MASELSIKGKKEFEGLTRALEWSNEFAIYFAVINPPLIRKQTAEELKRSLERKQIKVHSLELNSSYFDLLSIIPEKVPSYCFRGAETEIHSVLFIFGAEEAIAADADTRRLFFDCLNWQRDKLREILECPLVIWLPEFALRILAFEAPDFWAWRSGVYYLEPEPEWILKVTKELLNGRESEYDVLTYQEKVRHLQQFKALLDDYEQHQFEGKLESEVLEIRFNLLQEAGKVSFSLANYEDAKQYFLQSLKIAERLKDKKLLVQIFGKLSLVSVYLGDRTSAKEYAEKNLEIAQELGKEDIVASSFGVLGIFAEFAKDYDKAEEFLKRSLEIRKELGDKKLIALAFKSLGSLGIVQGKHTEARSFLEQSLKISKEIGEKGRIVDNLLELSKLAQNQGNIDGAVRRIEEAQAISKEIKDRVKIAEVLEEKGSFARSQGDYQRARKYYNESLKVYELLGDKFKIASIYADLGKIASDSGGYEEAKRSYKESLKIFEEIGAKDFIALTQKLLEGSEKIKKLDQVLEKIEA